MQQEDSARIGDIPILPKNLFEASDQLLKRSEQLSKESIRLASHLEKIKEAIEQYYKYQNPDL